ncbi:MAG: phospholipase D family protein [Rudaea sp.]|nr:phospholipase D family protein [Rudaea sp.]
MNATYVRAPLLLMLGIAVSACSSLRSDFVKTPSQALPPAFDTPSARYVQSELEEHRGLSGFRLLTGSTNALMSRIALIDHAEHSIDLQYYIFENDATGRLVAQRLLAAADRGVRVRMLLDDLGLDHEDHMLDALDAHPNIKVRLFNPFNTRDPSLPSKIAQFILEGQRLNRRMHNKSLIADNAAAIVGGRNIGDGYFDARNDTNFRDLDVIAVGPVVTQASSAFDDYWNSDAAFPVTAFRNTRNTDADLVKVRAALAHDARKFADSDYAQASLEKLPYGATADRRGEWFWGSGNLLADLPEKIKAESDTPELRIGPQLKSVTDVASTEVLLISPYFVPGEKGTNYLIGLAQRGVAVKVLTNSLASTDEPAAHAGYEHYRNRLLAGGVQLFELRPAAGEKQSATAAGASSGVSLHAKAFVVDRRYVFVGSMNMDPRSKLLNTEMGVMVDCPGLAGAVAQFFATASSPANAFHVELLPATDAASGHARLTWVSESNGATVTYDHDPDATRSRRLEVSLLRLLPIEGLL